jgi:hypothetical protein
MFMFDHEIVNVSRYDGTGRTEKAIEIFETKTGKPVSFCRRRPYESKEAWVARAYQSANIDLEPAVTFEIAA